MHPRSSLILSSPQSAVGESAGQGAPGPGPRGLPGPGGRPAGSLGAGAGCGARLPSPAWGYGRGDRASEVPARPGAPSLRPRRGPLKAGPCPGQRRPTWSLGAFCFVSLPGRNPEGIALGFRARGHLSPEGGREGGRHSSTVSFLRLGAPPWPPGEGARPMDSGSRRGRCSGSSQGPPGEMTAPEKDWSLRVT